MVGVAGLARWRDEVELADQHASAITDSSIEKCCPMQPRGPPPNGNQAYRCRAFSRSGANRCGSNRCGWSQKSGWRWTTQGATHHVGAGRDAVAADLVVLDRSAAEQRRGRVEPHGLLQHHRRVRERRARPRG